MGNILLLFVVGIVLVGVGLLLGGGGGVAAVALACVTVSGAAMLIHLARHERRHSR